MRAAIDVPTSSTLQAGTSNQEKNYKTAHSQRDRRGETGVYYKQGDNKAGTDEENKAH